MKRHLTLFVLLLIGLCSLLPVYAQDANPTPKPKTRADNECYAGGTMAGKCDRGFHADGSTTPAEVEWAWRCGWYMARFNDNVITREEVPSDCGILLPGIPLPSCVLLSNGTAFALECLQGNVISEDLGNDGKVENHYYAISSSVVGNGGVCPTGAKYIADISFYTYIPGFISFMYSHGYKATDDICGPF